MRKKKHITNSNIEHLRGNYNETVNIKDIDVDINARRSAVTKSISKQKAGTLI